MEEIPRRDWEWRYVSHALEKLAIVSVWTGERSHFTLHSQKSVPKHISYINSRYVVLLRICAAQGRELAKVLPLEGPCAPPQALTKFLKSQRPRLINT